jgi:hypothetical protein
MDWSLSKILVKNAAKIVPWNPWKDNFSVWREKKVVRWSGDRSCVISVGIAEINHAAIMQGIRDG